MKCNARESAQLSGKTCILLPPGGRGARECTGHCTDLEPPLVLMRLSQGPPESTGTPSRKLLALRDSFCFGKGKRFYQSQKKQKQVEDCCHTPLIRMEINRDTQTIDLSWSGAQCGEDTQNAQGFDPQHHNNEAGRKKIIFFFLISRKSTRKTSDKGLVGWFLINSPQYKVKTQTLEPHLFNSVVN